MLRIGFCNDKCDEILEQYKHLFEEISILYKPNGTIAYHKIIEIPISDANILLSKLPDDSSWDFASLYYHEGLSYRSKKKELLRGEELDEIKSAMFNGYGMNDPEDGQIISRAAYEERPLTAEEYNEEDYEE